MYVNPLVNELLLDDAGILVHETLVLLPPFSRQLPVLSYRPIQFEPI